MYAAPYLNIRKTVRLATLSQHRLIHADGYKRAG
jgi:hypothetical protein